MIDFGAAEKIDPSRMFQIPFGTVYYVAPEVLRRSYDHRADIWSCGIIFYTMLCGYPPFNGETDFEIVEAILKQDLIFPRKEWENIPEDLIDLIR